MAVRLRESDRQAVAALDADLGSAARAIGAAMAQELGRRRPALSGTAGAPGPDAVVEALELEHDGPPDAVTLAACMAAHGAYVSSRGHPEGLSLGALALARLLAWASRAALLGPAPRLVWIGPPQRAPAPSGGQVVLTATCRATVDGVTREARAAAVVARA